MSAMSVFHEFNALLKSLLQNLKYNFWKNCKKIDDCNL